MATITPKRHAVVDTSHCVACGACAEVCPRGAITVWKGSYSVVDDGLCIGCGLCAKECPASVIRLEARP
jgi:ferredoxin